MIVALAAVRGQPKVNPTESLHSVSRVDRPVLCVDCPAFVGRHVAALKPRCDQLVTGWIVQQVTGKLLDRELIEGHVFVVSLDDPIAIRPHLTIVIEVHPVRVSVSRRVEPIASSMFSPGRTFHQLVDPFGDRFVAAIIEFFLEAFQVFDRRRQARDVQAQTSEQRFGICIGCWLESFGFQASQNVAIDFRSNPRIVFDFGWFRFLRHDQRPVL